MRTIVWYLVTQLALRNCSKDIIRGHHQRISWESQVSISVERGSDSLALTGVFDSGQHGAMSMLTGAEFPEYNCDTGRKMSSKTQKTASPNNLSTVPVNYMWTLGELNLDWLSVLYVRTHHQTKVV